MTTSVDARTIVGLVLDECAPLAAQRTDSLRGLNHLLSEESAEVSAGLL